VPNKHSPVNGLTDRSGIVPMASRYNLADSRNKCQIEKQMPTAPKKKNILHTTPVLPAHAIQCISYLAEAAIFYAFHKLGKKIAVVDGYLLQIF
jgi:hypothetical protein